MVKMMNEIAKFDGQNPLIPSPPGELNQDGLNEWNRVCTIFQEGNILNELDLSMLFAYCNEYGKYLFFERELKSVGRIAKAPSGYPMIHPYESMAKKALATAMEIAKQFGMTPISRKKIGNDKRNHKRIKFELD